MAAWQKGTFSRQVLLTMLTVALAPMLLYSVFMLVMLLNNIEAQLGAQAQAQLQQVQTRLDETGAALEQSVQALADNSVVRQALSGKEKGEQALYQAMLTSIGNHGNLAWFSLHDSQGKRITATGKVKATERLAPDWGLLRRVNAAQGSVLAEGQDDAVLFAACPIPGADGQTVGYAVAAVTAAQFQAMQAGAYDRANNLLVVNPYFRMLYHPQPSQGAAQAALLRDQWLAGQRLTGEGDAFRFYLAQNLRTGFTLVLEQPNTFTASVLQGYYLVGGAIGLLSIGLSLWGTMLFSRRLSKPVGAISDAMQRVEHGDFSVRLKKQRNDELGRLARGFNRMMNEYQSSVERSVSRQKELNETRIRMLQSQLNPHFLYNTLDSVRWLGVTHHAPKIATLATDLATLLRASIAGDEFLTLEAELELLEHYTDIQAIRFEDRFTCEIAVAERFQGCMVPKLMLQPLVENAILHGVADQQDGYLKIWAEQIGDDLAVYVSDNGRGMPQETVDHINHIAQRVPGTHLGLFNVDSILRLHFGPAYGVRAESRVGEGSCVSVRLPLRRQPKPEGEEAAPC